MNRIQIHKATAGFLNIKPDRDGFYYAPESTNITLKNHIDIIMKIQVELQAYYLKQIELIKDRGFNL